MARRHEGRVRKSDALNVDAVVESAAKAVRRAWEQDDQTP
jgi:hypothetical protein